MWPFKKKEENVDIICALKIRQYNFILTNSSKVKFNLPMFVHLKTFLIDLKF